jgi:hypothetical protein
MPRRHGAGEPTDGTWARTRRVATTRPVPSYVRPGHRSGTIHNSHVGIVCLAATIFLVPAPQVDTKGVVFMSHRIRSLVLAPLLLFAFVLIPVQHAAASGITAAAAADFTVTVDPLAQTRKRGTGAPYFVTLTSVNGFGAHVSLSLSGDIPATGVVTISDPTGFGPTHDGEVAIQIQKHSVLTGTFAMTIHATGGGIEHDVNISLTIE